MPEQVFSKEAQESFEEALRKALRAGHGLIEIDSAVQSIFWRVYHEERS